jgi:cyanate permease
VERDGERPPADIPQWISFSPVANTAATFFDTTPSIVNWLSTAFLFAFAVASPAVLYVLSRHGPRLAIIIAAVFILVGNWIRFAGTRVSPPSYGCTMVGQILIGFAQPFVLSAPTRYSDIWFTPQGRVSATAVMSLANPFGGALGQLINPFLVNTAADIPTMTLYVAIISSVATIPSFFIPAAPPTPVAPSSAHAAAPMRAQLRQLGRNPTFWLLFVPFGVYVGFFNSMSSLLTQILTPYGYNETQSGIAGGLLILVGLITAAVTSPLVDRYKRSLPVIQVLVPVVALCYLAFIWAPPAASIVAPYVVCSLLGAASFSLVPIALEFLAGVTYPVGPELSSVTCWTAGQLLGGIFIVTSDALEDGADAQPPWNLHRALILQAVITLAVVPCVFVLGRVGGAGAVRDGRMEADRRAVDGGQDAAPAA